MATSKHFQFSYYDQEYQFIIRDENDIKDFECKICLQLCFKAVQTSCGHLFCGRCLKKWISEKKGEKICPTCKTSFTGAVIEESKNEKIRNLTVLCPNVSRGCEWKEKLGSVEAHKKVHGEYLLVQCPKKCGTAVERRELEEHKKDHCELREYKCPYCENDSKGTFKERYCGTFKDFKTKHLKKCGGNPVDCPNNCGAQGLVEGDLPSHLAACPAQVLPCRYQTLGCKVRLARKEMSGHLEDKDGHLVLAMGTTADLVQQFSQLSRVEAEHRASTDSQQQQITTLQQQMSILLEKSGVQLPSAPPHPDKPWLKVDPLPLYPPFTVKMNDVSIWNVSPPFTSHPGGYRLAVRTELAFHPLVNKTLDLYLDPIDCPENHSLKWPVTITIKCVFLNEEEDKYHKERELKFKLQHPNTSTANIVPLDHISTRYITVSEVEIHT